MKSRRTGLALTATAGAIAIAAWAAQRPRESMSPATSATVAPLEASVPPPLAEVDVAVLARTFEAGTTSVRRAAIEDAARAGTPEAVDWLASVAEGSQDTANAAGTALGTVSNPRAAARLGEIVTSDRPVLVRANAARALGRAGGPEQLPLLQATFLSRDSPLRLRQESALAAAHAGRDRAVAALARALDDSRDPLEEQLRLSFVSALESVGDADAQAALERHRARDLSTNERAFVDHALRTVSAGRDRPGR